MATLTRQVIARTPFLAGPQAAPCLCTLCVGFPLQLVEESVQNSVGSSNEVGDCKLPFLPIFLNLWALYSVWDMVERDVIQVEWQ